MSHSPNDKSPTEQLIDRIDNAPLPQYPCAPRAVVTEQAPGIPAFNPAAKCSPLLTQCPRCNNPHHACDQNFGVSIPAAPAPTKPKLGFINVTNTGQIGEVVARLTPESLASWRASMAATSALATVLSEAAPAPTEQAGDVSFCTDGTPMATYTPAKLDQDWEQAGELPPLPAYELVLIKQYMVGNYLSVYRGFQMQDHARAAYAMGRASAVRDYVCLNDAARAARPAPLPSDFLMPEDAWNEYATRSGLLNEHGVAPHPATTQATYFAYQAAWNCLHKAFSAYIAARQAPDSRDAAPRLDCDGVPERHTDRAGVEHYVCPKCGRSRPVLPAQEQAQ